MKWFPQTKKSWIRFFILFVGLPVLFFIWLFFMMQMPGKSYQSEFASLNDEERAVEVELREHVRTLAGQIGARGLLQNPRKLGEATEYLSKQLTQSGYEVHFQTFDVKGTIVKNVEVELLGKSLPQEIILIGAHYDTVWDCPGANDNTSGTAALLALAKRFASTPCGRTIRFVAFVNEEPPFFQTADMGSVRYAKRCKERGEKIVAMLSLETIGYFSDEKGSQKYPAGFGVFYPSQGNFISFVGNVSSCALVRQSIRIFRQSCSFPSEGAALPGFIPGIGWSDHWSFWQHGYPAIMITDTAPFRYPHYHEPSDTPDKLCYDKMARVTVGLSKVITALANEK